MTEGIKTQGTEIHFLSAGSPAALVELGYVKSFGGLGGTASEIDVTHFQSARKEFLRGLRDGGTVNLGVILVAADAGQQALFALDDAGTAVQFCISLSDGVAPPTETGGVIVAPADRASFIFTAFVQQATVNGDADNAVMMDVQLRVTGDVTKTFN